MGEPSSASEDQVIVGDDDNSEVERADPRFEVKVTHEAKLKEILHMINTIEIKLCSAGVKEFIKLLKGNTGGELLRLYIRASSNCSELLDAWKLQRGKPGLSYILSLVSTILGHPDGMYNPNDAERIAVSRVLDKLAKFVMEEYMIDVYKELNSTEVKHQNAALLLMASIVRRRPGLASEFAKKFDFKLKAFSKLSVYKKNQNEKRMKQSSRKAFVGFAMSFLEVGRPGLLRWVLQQKEMYSGVLRGLGDDDDETIIYVLSTLRDRVLVEESLVPPGLRSVLFGSVTLEQLVSISGREMDGPAAELSYRILVLVCSDPCNGLMPDLKRHPSPLKGNPKRLVELMKKLKATEIGYHRYLLLAIVSGSPSFGSAYMEEFPYNLEDFASPTCICRLSTVSLAANLVSSVGTGHPFGFLDSRSHNPPLFDDADVQSILKCLFPRPFSRSVINKGLLHSNFVVMHGTLKLLLEALKLLDSFIGALNHGSYLNDQRLQGWASLKQEIQNEVRTLLPDPQVLLTLLSSLTRDSKTHGSCLKRTAYSENFTECSGNKLKKLKKNFGNKDPDIIVSGIGSTPGIALTGDSERVVGSVAADETDSGKDLMVVIAEIWDLGRHSMPLITLEDTGIFIQSKLLDALKIYIRTAPTALEGSFDFFIGLLNNPLAMPINLQCSLLSLLTEYIGFSPSRGIPIRTPPQMYKHLQSFINLFIFSPITDIKDLSHGLAQAAMFSTGAFDKNLDEIGAWFLFLPSYDRGKSYFKVPEVEPLQSLSPVVISFLCDAISTIGNNLFKYWDIVKHYTYHLKVSPTFSPLAVCVLQKCLRLLTSESGSFTLPEKSIISVYVCNTLKYLLQTQVDAGSFSALVESVLSERLGDHCCAVDDSRDFFSEWSPLENLFLFSQSISNQQTSCIFSTDKKSPPNHSSFASTLDEVKRLVRSGDVGNIAGITKAFSSSIICTLPDVILINFPSVMTISYNLCGVPMSILLSEFFLEQSLLTSVSKLWPKMFFPGLEVALSIIHCKDGEDDASGNPCRSLDSQMVGYDGKFGESESAAAFGFFLKQVPFHVLFPAIMNIEGPYSLEPLKMQDLLLAKLSDSTADCHHISYLRLVLFWIHQIKLSYKSKPIIELQQLADICFNLVENLLAQLLILKTDSDSSRNSGFPVSRQVIQDVAESIFCHPAVVASLSCPIDCKEDLGNINVAETLDMLICLSKQTVHKLDHCILSILTTTSEYLLTLCSDQNFVSKAGKSANKQLVGAFNALMQRLFLEARDKFDLCILTKDMIPFLPTFYALHALIRFISPFELLEFVQWMFNSIDMHDLTVWKSSKTSALAVGFCIAAGAFKTLSSYLEHPVTKRVSLNALWGIEEENINIDLIEEIYIKVVNFAMHSESNFADTCLLEAVNAGSRQKHNEQQSIHPLSLIVSRVIMITPVEMLSHCIYRTSKTKAKLLFLLIETSSLHLSIFGHLFLDIINKVLHEGNMKEESCGLTLSDEDFIILLPAAMSYLNAIFMKFGKQCQRHVENMDSLYSRILWNGFLHWKSFVSGNVFDEEYGEFLPSSTQELRSLVDGSLLGKSIHMLQYHFAYGGVSMKMKRRLKLFDKLFPHSTAQDELLDWVIGEMDSSSLNQSLNHMNRIIAKLSLCRILLFPKNYQMPSLQKEAGGDLKEGSLEMGSNSDASRMRFINILVSIWQWIVKKFPILSDSCAKEKSTDSSMLCRYLEVFILESIFELTKEMHGDLVRLQSVPFLEQLMRSALLYRFEDPTTLKALQHILTSLCDVEFSRVPYLQLLVAHSQFAPTLHSVFKSSGSPVGAFLRPMSSILRSLVISSTKHNAVSGECELFSRRLEVIKLLRVLFPDKAQFGFDSGKDFGINFRELHLLLLSSYGATLSEVDLMIYSLMHDIESVNGSDFVNTTETDHLWGSSALKVKKERDVERDICSDIMSDTEGVGERRKNQFRENLSIDPKICVSTVLYFPYDAIAVDEPLSLKKAHPPEVGKIERYDPFFILHFSIHSLSLGYIEPMEFAGLGLLAVAFVSISSSDDRIRKLGYETLGIFKCALEKFQKRKDVMQLRLLLTYVQNGVEEPWQKIPSVIALFAAESSFILLDPSHDHYTDISKLLMQSSRVNMKGIPLFQKFFWSSSVNFKAERLWILRLLYAGLNMDDDAQIYIRNSIIETLFSFYVCPLSDNNSKALILQIVKKSVKLHKMARYLVQRCGLFSWLSSILSFSSDKLFEDKESFFLMQLHVVLEVVIDAISSRNITEWLQKDALQQLIELSLHLYKFLIGGSTFIEENVALLDPFLQIIISTLKISQKRKIYQPHFTLSVEGLYQMYQSVNVNNYAGSCPCAEAGLRAILMGTPAVAIFHMSCENLSSFLMWAISTASKADSQMLQLKESRPRFTISSEEEIYEESLRSKLLRWLTAAVILGKLSWKSNDLDPELSNRLKLGTLQSLWDLIGNARDESIQNRFGCENLLAAVIFYLQQHLGINCRVLPSVISALCLLFYASSFAEPRSDIFLGNKTLVASLCLKIRYPAEANPSWRWSYYQPWKDLSLELTDLQKMDELHTCQTLLVIFANALRKKPSDLQVLSSQDMETSGVYEWERSIIKEM
ncbi:uncharacterized protein LOC122281567 isoform X5 [Carya illinoinensis]|uniref:uncharacterized protein LOC122281567 isoform X5 n=1 Tax=Carya illinoinensis TaxID=32201 RepID=UPI001C72893F|nr:uncharacterized protein LOC122281567 isoform X5 [Carya illinoinensis]